MTGVQTCALPILSQDDAPTLEVLYRNVLQSVGEGISSAAEFAERLSGQE